MITIYSKSGCPHCTAAKVLLTEWGIDWIEVRIDLDATARNFVLSKGHKTVPQLYIGSELLVSGGANGLRELSPEYISERLKEGNK